MKFARRSSFGRIVATELEDTTYIRYDLRTLLILILKTPKLNLSSRQLPLCLAQQLLS
jgi:hypothetical protein